MSRQVPDCFKCPITREIMKDPVCTEDGHTYDRKAIETWLEDHDTSPKTGAKLQTKDLVSNHVLSRAIDAWLDAWLDNRLSDAHLKTGTLSQPRLKRSRSAPQLHGEDPANVFWCSLTGRIIREPSLATDGFTYEHEAIVKWVDQNDKSPVTGLPLETKKLVTNYALQQAIADRLSETSAQELRLSPLDTSCDQPRLTRMPSESLDERPDPYQRARLCPHDACVILEPCVFLDLNSARSKRESITMTTIWAFLEESYEMGGLLEPFVKRALVEPAAFVEEVTVAQLNRRVPSTESRLHYWVVVNDPLRPFWFMNSCTGVPVSVDIPIGTQAGDEIQIVVHTIQVPKGVIQGERLVMQAPGIRIQTLFRNFRKDWASPEEQRSHEEMIEVPVPDGAEPGMQIQFASVIQVRPSGGSALPNTASVHHIVRVDGNYTPLECRTSYKAVAAVA